MDYGLQPGKPEHEVQSLQKSSDRNENISLEPLVVWERDSSQLAGNNCILIVDVSIGHTEATNNQFVLQSALQLKGLN